MWKTWILGCVLLVGCHRDGNDQNGRGDGGGPSSSDGATGGPDLAQPVPLTLTVTPPTATLEVTDLAVLPSLTLSAIATYSDQSMQAVPASWSVDRFDIVGIGVGTGVVSAAGTAFGTAKVTAQALGLSATADITVRLKLVVNPAGVSGSDQLLLHGATVADPAITSLSYPYDKTVFPRGLIAPELMWSGGDATSTYLIHLTAPSFDVSFFFQTPTPSRFPLPQDLWNILGATAKGGDTSVELRRLTSGGSAYLSATETWRIADANLRGTIYYWAINLGQVLKLDVSTGQRSQVFDSGANTNLGTPTPLNAGSPRTPPWEDAGGSNSGKRCVACHSVSKNGSRLAGVFTRESSAGPVGVVDLSTQQTVSISDYESNTIFTALSPDGALSVANFNNKTMRLLDGATGGVVSSALDALSDVCDPMFSPDGKRFALAANCDPGFGYPVEFRTSDLVVYDFAQSTNTFSNPLKVLTSTGLGDAIAFPSFSPDSKYVVLQRGDYSRAKYGNTGMGQYYHGVDDLYVVEAKAGATAIALDQANGKGVLPADSLHLNYAPTVNPIAEGGYMWVVFTSPRDYGNRMVSPAGVAPADATYSNRKQLWVAAVDASIGTIDPSHPAFWLPGQDPSTTNMFGYWSLAPCKPSVGVVTPPSCTAGFECCSGFCRDTGQGPMCTDAPTGCHQVGEKCMTDADCCGGAAGVSCIAGICQQITIL